MSTLYTLAWGSFMLLVSGGRYDSDIEVNYPLYPHENRFRGDMSRRGKSGNADWRIP